MQILIALMWFFCVFVLPSKELSHGETEQIPLVFFVLVSVEIINQFVATFYGVHSTRLSTCDLSLLSGLHFVCVTCRKLLSQRLLFGCLVA